MTRHAITAMILFCALQNAEAARFALLVGNSTAQGNYAQLKYVQNDITSFKEILEGFCGFDKQHIVTLFNTTPDELDRSMNALADKMAAGSSKDNMFLFYYSGHADQTSLKMGDSVYPLVALKKKFSDFPCDMRIGIFDACQSGSFTRIKGGTLSEPFLFKDDGKTRGQVILCSSSINENAQESDALGNSIFTFHFINALRGSGDLSGDGRVTLSEAYQYSYNHTLSSTAGSAGGIQHPSYQFRIQGEGDFVLADLNISSQGILLSQDLSGDITILNANNVVVADLSKKKSSAIMIALSPGTYSIIQGVAEKRFQASATVKDNSIVKVSRDMFVSQETGTGRKKGESWQHSVQIGVTLSGGLARFDLSSLGSDLSGRFAAYQDFSIIPNFSFTRNRQLYQVAFEAIVRERFIAYAGFGTMDWSAGADYAGSRSAPPDSASFATRLHTEHSFNVNVFDLETGYRFQNRFVKNLSVLVGLSIYTVKLDLSSVYSDSLYDVISTGSGTNQGAMVLPHVALGYCWPVASWCDVGAKVRYRYQKSPAELDGGATSNGLSGQAAAVPLRYNFGGFEGNLSVNVHFTIVRSE